jgi:hypothetical protein
VGVHLRRERIVGTEIFFLVAQTIRYAKTQNNMKNNLCNTPIASQGIPPCDSAPTKAKEVIKFVGQDVIDIMKGLSNDQLKDLFRRVRFKYTNEGDEIHIHSTRRNNLGTEEGATF